MSSGKKNWHVVMIVSVLLCALMFSTITAAEGQTDYILYTVKEGDTLSSVAEYHNTTVDKIITQKSGKPVVGDVLKIEVSTGSDTPGKNGKKSGFTMDMRDADIRDVLSIFAVALKKNILYTEAPVNVSINVNDVSPTQALNLLAKSVDMEWIEDGNLIIMGRHETILRNFYTMLPITRFSLSYISPEEINRQIDVLNIPVQKLVLDSTNKYIWAQGTPHSLAKVSEIIQVLDRAENIDPQTQEAIREFKLTPLTLEYVEAGVLNGLIRQLDIPCRTILIDANPRALWVEADETALRDINTLIGSVDILENRVPEEVEEPEEEEEVIDNTKIEAKKMMNITSARLMPLIQSLDIPVKVIAIDSSGYNIWMRGDQASINMMNDLINRLDNYYSRDDINFFTYTLSNLKAATALERLEFIGLDDVRVMSLNYPQFSSELLISCPSDRISDVKNVLKKLDVQSEKIKVFVDSADISNGAARLETRRDLIVLITGIPKNRFQISKNISKTEEHHYVLWVEETPENIQLIQETIISMDAPLGAAAEQGE